MDANHVIFPIAFDTHTAIEGDTPVIMHPEPLLHLVTDLPNQAHVSNHKQIINVQNNWANDCSLILIMEHVQSSFNP